MVFDIEKLEAKSEKIDIMGQTITINPLTVPELIEFMRYAEKSDINNATQYLAFAALRPSVPIKNMDTNDGMTDAELKEFIVKKISSKALLKLVAAVRRVSGLTDDDDEKNNEGNDQ